MLKGIGTIFFSDAWESPITNGLGWKVVGNEGFMEGVVSRLVLNLQKYYNILITILVNEHWL